MLIIPRYCQDITDKKRPPPLHTAFPLVLYNIDGECFKAELIEQVRSIEVGTNASNY